MRLDDGGDWWFCDGRKVMGAFAGGQTGRRFEEPEKLSSADTMDNVRPGGYLPEEHVTDMELDGVDGGVIYPTVGLLLFTMSDSELMTAIFRACNDWLAEFCRPFPNKLKGIAMLDIDDLPAGITELERCANLGLAGAMLTCSRARARPAICPSTTGCRPRPRTWICRPASTSAPTGPVRARPLCLTS